MKRCPTCHTSRPDSETKCSRDGAVLVADALLGATLGAFRIVACIAEGGLGVVYRAEHTTIGRKAAVKVLRREFAHDPTTIKRFEREARAVSRIAHPHLVDVFDIGTAPDGRLYYVMELLEGRSLADRMAAGPVPFAEFGPSMRDACEALEAAHALDVVHRDLKPQNLFLVERPGEKPAIKVLDFGIAKIVGTDQDVQTRLTRTGMILGTPQYMAPEQIEGGAVDQRADVYAIGVILYELATGSLPFRAQTLGQILKAHLTQQPPAFDAGRLAPGVPPTLEAVVRHALSKSPGDRYPTMSALRQDLDRVLAGKRSRSAAPPLATPPPPQLPPPPASVPRSPKAGPNAVTQMMVRPDLPRPPSRVLPWVAGAAIAVIVGSTVVLIRRSATRPTAPATGAASSSSGAPAARRPGVDVPAARSKALAAVTEALKDGDPAIRREALHALAEGRDERHSSLVEPRLDDADLQVRSAAISTLARLAGRRALPTLRPLLKDKNVQLTAAEALAHLGDPDGEKLLQQTLRRGDDAGRLRAAMALEKAADADKWLRKRPSDGDDPLTVAVLARLARAGDRDASARLAALTAGHPPATEVAAAETLAKLGDEKARGTLAAIAATSAPAARLLAFRALAAIDDFGGYDVFLATMGDRNASPELRLIAAQGLGACGDKAALKTLLDALDDEDRAVRLAAAGAVLAIVAVDPKTLASKSVEWATTALSDDSWVVRQQAVSVLADAEASVAVPLLGKAIRDVEPEVRRAAATSLGKTRAPQAVPFLTLALDDKKDEIRVTAIRSMGRIGHASAKPVLVSHIQRASKRERVVVAGQLAKLGDKSHIGEIRDAMSSGDPAVRKVAVEESEADPDTAKAATSHALGDSAFEVRFAAALQLASKGDKDGAAVLQEAVKKGGSDGLQAYVALEKLGVRSETALEPAALLASKDVGVRVHAVEAAASLSGDDIVQFLTKAFADADSRVRLAVIESAAASTSPAAQGIVKRGLGDNDPAVRAMAEALTARLAEKESSHEGAPAGAAEDMAPPAEMPDLAPPPSALIKEEAAHEEGEMAMTSGELALKAGRLDVAMRELQRAHHLDSKLPVAFSLGETYRKLGERERDPARQRDDFTKAVSFYQKSRDKKAAAYAAELQERIKAK